MSSATAASGHESAFGASASGGRLRHFSLGEPGFPALELGLRALADARDLADATTGQHSALLLYRSSLVLFLSACSARNAEPPPSAAKLWTALEQLPELKTAFSSLTLAQVPLVAATLTSEVPELVLLSLSREEREQSLLGLRRLALALGERLALDAHGARSLLLARRLKIGAAVLCLLLPLAWTLLKPTNFALHRPVEVSSRSAQYGVEPSQVVDGKRVNLGFHSAEEKGPHIATVDLGTVRRIHRVDVFNRVDCCGERALPLRLEVSSDRRSFRKLLVRTDAFSLWKAEFPATEARYVRLVQKSDSAFHLSEIEVY